MRCIVNTSVKNKKEKSNSLFDRLGSITEKRISLIACISMGLCILVPVFICFYALFVKEIDRIQGKHELLIQIWILPLVSLVAFVLYILRILKLRKEKKGLKDIVSHTLLIVFSGVVLLMVISQIYNGIGYALEGYSIVTIGETFDMEVAYFIFVLFTASQVKDEGHKKLLIRTHILVSFFVMIAGFFLWKVRIEIGDSSFIQDVGFASIFWNINYYGYYLAFTIPLAAAAFIGEKKVVWKIVSGIGLVANTVAISINDTFGAWIGAAVAMIFIIVSKSIIDKKANIQSVILLLVFMVSLYIPGHILGTFEANFRSFGSDLSEIVSDGTNAQNAGSGRWKIWESSIEVIKDNPILGIGFEGVNYKKLHTFNARPHNEFIQYALFHGIPMMLAYFAGCLGIFIRALRKKRILDSATFSCLSAAFGYLVSSFFGLTVFSTAYYLFIFLGMGYVHDKEVKAEN